MNEDQRRPDVVVRPKWIYRIGSPGAALGGAWGVLVERERLGALATFCGIAVTLTAWNACIVVIEPTLLWRNTFGRWREIDLRAVDHVDAYYSGRIPTLTLEVSEGKQRFSMERLFWDSGWTLVFGYVAKWTEWARLRDPTFRVPDRATRRIGRFRRYVD